MAFLQRIPQLLLYIFISISVCISTKMTVVAADDTGINTVKEQLKPDKHDRRTPIGTVQGFLKAVADEDYERASAYLNIDSDTKTGKGKEELVKKFQYLLDHSGEIYADALINSTVAGNVKDSLDLDKEQVGIIYIDDEKIPVLLEQIKDQDNIDIWVFSSETINKILKSQGAKSDVINIVDYAPSFLIDNKILGVAIGYWLMMFLAGLFSFLIAKIVISFIVIIINSTITKFISEQISLMITAIRIPARMWLSVYLFITSLQYLSVPIIMRQHFNSIALALYLIAVLILAWQLTNIAHFLSIERFKKYNNAGVISILDFVRKSIRFSLIVIGILIGLHLYDHNVTTGLAALGIGGLAIALGAQKTLENIAGSINVVADRSVNIGDFCKIGDVMGVIEEVGIRSTKIRTLARSIVTIPNSEFSNHIVENNTRKDKYRYYNKICVRYETSPDQLRYIVVNLESLLYAHTKIEKDFLYAAFTEFGPDALIIEVAAHVRTKQFLEFVKIKQDLNLRIIDIINNSGTSFAFPSQTVYLSRDHGLSQEKAKEAESKVKQWLDENSNQLNGLSEEDIIKISNSIHYKD